jgi:hypothetical protein
VSSVVWFTRGASGCRIDEWYYELNKEVNDLFRKIYVQPASGELSSSG